MIDHLLLPSETSCIARSLVEIDTLAALSINPLPWTVMTTWCLATASIFFTT